MKLTGETKFFAGVIIATVVILIGAIALFSAPPKEVPLDVLGAQDAWATGSAQPKVTLVEFADFECPACGAAFPVVKQVVAKYQNDLRYVFRHFPLDQHKNARLAAQAAEAAGAQGKFWEMHDLLFQNQSTLSPDVINGLGIELKLDMEKFTQEVTAEAYKAKIEKDLTDGQTLGVNSTPTFYLNGKKLSLFSFTDLDAEVKKALEP
jgi:protein-disulfide isomerase